MIVSFENRTAGQAIRVDVQSSLTRGSILSNHDAGRIGLAISVV